VDVTTVRIDKPDDLNVVVGRAHLCVPAATMSRRWTSRFEVPR